MFSRTPNMSLVFLAPSRKSACRPNNRPPRKVITMRTGGWIAGRETEGVFMKSSGSESKDARFSRLNYVLQSAAIVAISGSFVAASLILGGQAPRPVRAQGIKAQPIVVSNPDGS